MQSTVREFLRAQFGLTQPADELPADGGMGSEDWDAAQRPSAPTDWSQPVQPQPEYQIADGRTAPPTPQGDWQPVQTVPNPQRTAAVPDMQVLAEDSVSTPPGRVTAYDGEPDHATPAPARPMQPPPSPYSVGQAESMEPRADRFETPEPTQTQSAFKPVWDAAGNVVGYVQERGGRLVEQIVDPKPIVGQSEADRRLLESARTVGQPAQNAVGAAGRQIEQTMGLPEGAARQAAEDVSGVLGPEGAVRTFTRAVAPATRAAGRAAQRVVPEVGLAIDDVLTAPNTGQAAGVAERVIEAQQPRALAAPAERRALPPASPSPQEASRTWREFSQSLNTPEEVAARRELTAPVSRATAEDAPIREQFGRPWEEVYGPNRAVKDPDGEATAELVSGPQSFRGRPREQAYPDEIAAATGRDRIDPDTINLNSAAGGLVGAGSGGLTGEEEDGEFDLNRALMGAVIGAVAGPKAAKTAAARNDAMVRAWNRGPRKAPGSSLPWRTRLAGAWTDDLAPFAQMEREAEQRLKRTLTDDEKISVLARANPDGAASQRLQRNIVPAIRGVTEAGGNLDDLNLRLMLTHNVDVAKEMGRRAYQEAIDAGRSVQQAAAAANRAVNDRKFFGGTGLPEMVEQLEALQQKIVAEGGQKALDAYDAAAEGIWKHQADTLEDLVTRGIVSREAADELAQRYPHYIKTYVLDFDNPTAAIPNAGGRGVSLRQNLVKPLTTQGSERETLSPLESIVRRTIEAERAGHKNDLFQAFVKLIDEDDTLRQSVTARSMVGTKEITGFVNGERQTMRIARPLADVLERPGQGPHIPILSDILNWWKQGITSRNPGFSMVVSPMRDAADFAARQSAVEGGPQMIGRVARAYAEQLQQAGGDIFSGRTLQGQMTGDAQRFMEAGGFMGRLQTDERGINQIAREIARQGGVRATNQTVQDMMKDLATFGWAEKIGNRLEQVPRAAAMRLAEQRGADPLTAMMAGRDATIDFQRAGWLVRYANAIVPFLNPSVQSTAQVARLLRDHPKAAVATIGSLVAGPAIAAEAYNRADEQRARAYEDVPQYVRDSGVVVMMPWSGSDARGERPNYLWWPLGTFAPFATMARESSGAVMAQAGMGADPTRSAGELLTSMLTAYSPVKGDSASSVLSSVVPPGISTGIELGVDKDFFRNRRIATDARDEQASALSRGISGALNWLGRAGRGLPGTGGLEEVRPSQVEYAIRSDTGVYGQTALGASNLIAGNPREEDRPIQNATVVGSVAGRVIRDQGGERINQLTQPEALAPDGIMDVLDEIGMKRSDVTPVPSAYKGAPLSRDEQERWQDATNALITKHVRQAARAPEWRARGADRERLVREAITEARNEAAARALRRLTDSEIERRKQREERRKAG